MSDVWEQKYSVPSDAAALDYNGNGLTNLQKSLLGLDPRDSNAQFQVSVTLDAEQNQLRLHFDTQFGKLYQLESSTDLQNWASFGDLITGIGSPFETTIEKQSVSRIFYRGRFAGDLDLDGDGLTAWEEQQLGTSDNASDTDGDGISDSQEYQQGTDPTDYYNGEVAIIEAVSGDGQRGDPDTFLTAPLMARVINSAGQPFINAPVTFTISAGGGGLSASPAREAVAGWWIIARTDSTGIANAYLLLPSIVNFVVAVDAAAGSGSNAAFVSFAASTNDLPPPEAPSDVVAVTNEDGTTTITWQDNSNNENAFVIEKQNPDGSWQEIAWVDANVSSFTISGQAQNYRVRSDRYGAGSNAEESNPVTVHYAVIDLQQSLNLPFALHPLYLTNSGYVLLSDGQYNYRWHNGQIEDVGQFTSYMDMIEDGTLVTEPTREDPSDPIAVWKVRNGVTVGGGTLTYGYGTSMNVINGEEKPFEVFDINSQGVVLALDERAAERFLFYDHLNNQRETEFISYPSFFSEPWPYTLNHHVITVPDGEGNPTTKVSPQVVGANYSQEKAAIWEEDPRTAKYNHRYLNQAISSDSGWNLKYATGINDPGMIACIGNYQPATGPAQDKACLLLPVELMVDANTDGQMSFEEAAIHDKDGTSEQKPYRFWINNDHDEERTVDGDDREQDDYDEAPDFDNQGLLCERDLEDWSRLWINFKGIVGLIKTPGVTLELAWKPTDGGTVWSAVDGSPGIKVMLHDSLAGAANTDATYLTEKSYASFQTHGVWSGVIRPVTRDASYVLTQDFLQFVTEDTPYLYLLFEGYTAGKGQLVLNIRNDGQKIGEYPPIYLELKDVKDMYERWTVGDVTTANTSVASSIDYQVWPASSATLMPMPSGKPLVPPADEAKDYVLWVHGWNMSPFDKDSFGDTAFKRLFWQGYKGRFGAFRWPTFYFTGDIPPVHHFDASEHRAWASSLGLLSLLNQLNGGPFSGKVRMMAHSMGNVVAGEALRRSQSGQVVHTYVASQAAIPAHCYDANAPLMDYASGAGPTTPNVYAFYWQQDATSQPHQWQSEGRPSYMHPDYMTGKAGRYFNYYNDRDWALNGTHWQFNQQTKPDADYGYEYGGFAPSTGFWRDRGFGATWLTFPTDRHEIFAWAAESQSYALGAQWVGGVITGSTGLNRDLKAQPFGYTDKRKYHSGQFRGMYMERNAYWKQLLIDYGLKEAQ